MTITPMTHCPNCSSDLSEPSAIAANASARDWYHCGKDRLGQPTLLKDRHQHIGHHKLWCTKCEAYLDIHTLCPWP